MNVVDWSRAQFALTACYHWLFVPLTLGLGIIIGVMETFVADTAPALREFIIAPATRNGSPPPSFG